MLVRLLDGLLDVNAAITAHGSACDGACENVQNARYHSAAALLQLLSTATWQRAGRTNYLASTI
jgi:hypothetical protein